MVGGAIASLGQRRNRHNTAAQLHNSGMGSRVWIWGGGIVIGASAIVGGVYLFGESTTMTSSATLPAVLPPVGPMPADPQTQAVMPAATSTLVPRANEPLPAAAAGAAPPVAAVSSSAPTSRLQLSSVVTQGLEVGPDHIATAMISLDGQPAQSYRLGAVIGGEFTFLSISNRGRDITLVSRDGQTFRLTAPGSDTGSR